MTLHPVLHFTGLCSVIVLGVLLGFWAFTGFSDFGMGAHGVIAMVLGAVFSVVLASALMGLLFHSEHVRARDDRSPPP